MEVEMLWGGNGCLNVQIHCNIKAKLKQNRRKSKRHAKENEQLGEARTTSAVGTTARGVPHGQAVVPTAVVVSWLPPNAAFWSSWFFALGRRFLPFLGYFGPLLAIIF